MAEADTSTADLTREQLEARIAELESELARKEAEPEERGRPERDDSAYETSRRTLDEADRLFRSMTLAYIEGLRSAADAVGTFADEVARRNQPGDENLIRNLPGDIFSSYLKAVNRAMEVPERSVDKFQESMRRSRRSD